ncbi:hypothetical protein U91I_01690 [alpha proteobacterium U9-1i]|nr:hypothetical protein U91I_01690 [alpha proteobacterium U9-1i]
MRLAFLAPALALTLAASVAQAQMVYIPTTPTIRLLPTNGTSFAETTGARGSVTTAPDRPIATVSALSMFALGFENGDHKFRRIQVLPNGASARFALNDLGDDDPFTARARWVNIVGGSAHSVTANSGGGVIAQVAITAAPANHTFVLRGFEFRRAAGTDANIRAMSINLAPAGDMLEITLVDDERLDLRPRRAVGRSGPDVGRRYTVVVQYAWVPNTAIAARGTITGSERGRDTARVPAGLAAIQGFSFNFGNSDHHLLTAAIDLNDDGGSAKFQDNNLDDPMRYEVRYVTLHGPT